MAGRKGERNRTILAAFEAGTSPPALAKTHGLTPSTVYAIIAMEKHKRTVAEIRAAEEAGDKTE
jgi:Mor family transcriptional regulator